MVLFELLSFTDEEVDLITSGLRRWSQKNHIDVHSERGEDALKRAIGLVSCGVKCVDELVARLDENCAPLPAERPSHLNGE
ncbi:hypothetical protein [Rhizobium sullae]|uniref:Uncharacterized protein n=1 Tax=Rhizobium sullae TaxID=50338 RepID=A0A4R3PRQ6_RHISU|nr:hypothetical protein [Rhizobium sullae]TCU07006.1 hypothetical protein EV132_13036 [Rhizobium sullae]